MIEREKFGNTYLEGVRTSLSQGILWNRVISFDLLTGVVSAKILSPKMGI
ncbi:hypothetical protein [Sphingobacterium endophyticum]|nr:hypothetical protein [Sphingobacterium endophyticum]